MILLKLQEIDKLKHILLSEEQLLLFNIFAKPEIFLDEIEEGEMGSPLKKKEDLVLKNEHVVEAMRKTVEKADFSEIDKRILDLVDEELLEAIQ